MSQNMRPALSHYSYVQWVRIKQLMTISKMDCLPNKTCPLCGKPNECVVADLGTSDAECWCASVTFSEETLSKIPEGFRGKACLCRACATKHLRTAAE